MPSGAVGGELTAAGAVSRLALQDAESGSLPATDLFGAKPEGLHSSERATPRLEDEQWQAESGGFSTAGAEAGAGAAAAQESMRTHHQRSSAYESPFALPAMQQPALELGAGSQQQQQPSPPGDAKSSEAAANGAKPSPLQLLFAEAQRGAAQDPEGAAACWDDTQLLEAVEGALTPPPGLGGKHATLWAQQPELLGALRLLAAILPHPPAQAPEPYHRMLQLVLDTAHACTSLNEEAVGLAMSTLTNADTTGVGARERGKCGGTGVQCGGHSHRLLLVRLQRWGCGVLGRDTRAAVGLK